MNRMKIKGCNYSELQILQWKQKNVFSIEHIIKALRKLPLQDAGQITSFVTFPFSRIKILSH